ncbi:UDP-N-acetylmuramoyl-tripeptide--D-alanyl-D-alanine ligase [Alphaproteobacteria bacterium]|nr:UDP-N-acetylmuramoyl-tripeptide--D-alanyl-D-alanine ligase [Alphaproteobacteria bacterium]
MKSIQDPVVWTSDEVSKVIGVKIEDIWICNGIEFDSRKVKKGNIFFALPGTKLDGHNFIKDAVKSGAVALIVNKKYKSNIYNNKLIKVDDVYKSLMLMANEARNRVIKTSNIIAITGSSGKTSTKEMIKSAFIELGLTYSNPGSFNNHVGVPYSLANMASNIEFGIFELGMNNSNEIRKLSNLVRPNIAIITNVSEAHIGNFDSIKDVIKAKAEIFEGIENNGNILINRDFEYFDEVIGYSKNLKNINTITYGKNSLSNIFLVNRKIIDGGQIIKALAYGKEYTYKITYDGLHQAINSLAVLGVLLITKCDVEKGIKNLHNSIVPIGRGNRHNIIINGKKSLLIDDSYNANPSSVIASLKSLKEIAENNRKVLILGEMGELGKFSVLLHKNIFNYLISIDINLVIFVGKNTKDLYKLSKTKIKCIWVENSEKIVKKEIIQLLNPMDTILVKGSRYMKMELIINFLIDQYKIEGSE